MPPDYSPFCKQRLLSKEAIFQFLAVKNKTPMKSKSSGAGIHLNSSTRKKAGRPL